MTTESPTNPAAEHTAEGRRLEGRFANLRGWAGLQRCDERTAVHAWLMRVRHALDAREQLVRVALRELAHRRSQHSGRRRHGLARLRGGGGDAAINCGCDLHQRQLIWSRASRTQKMAAAPNAFAQAPAVELSLDQTRGTSGVAQHVPVV